MRRPGIAEGDTAYYRYGVVVVRAHVPARLAARRGKPGRAWAAIRESEPAALAAGVNITLYKLWAFALASFMTGVAGGAARRAGRPADGVQPFPTQDSLTLLAAALIGGIYSLWGAVVAGVFSQLAAVPLPGAVGHRPEFLLILFGVGLLQVLLTAPGGLVEQLPEGHGQPRPADRRAVSGKRHGPRGGADVIEVEDLTVRFGGVTPIDDMTSPSRAAPAA